MDDLLKEALGIVKAQASVRTMTEDDMLAMVHRLAEGIRNISAGITPEAEDEQVAIDPRKAIKEKSITCVECGKVFKLIPKLSDPERAST